MSTSDTRTRNRTWSILQTASIEAHTFPSGDVLAEFKAMAEDWREEIRKDPQTGKSYVDITFTGPEVNTAKHWLIQVDLETKLPIRTAVWFNEDRQGPPHYEFTKIEYDPDIPEGYFNFTPPAGAQIIDCRESTGWSPRTLTSGPLSTNSGMRRPARRSSQPTGKP